MTSWAMPLAAAGFWAGLLLWPARPGSLGVVPAFVLGVGALIASWRAAAVPTPRDAGEPAGVAASPLARAGLLRVESGPVATLAPHPIARGRHGVAVVSLAAVGVVLLGLAWGGIAEWRLRGSLLARLGPVAVEAEGTLREDPAAGSFGWHAVADVTQVTWPGGTDRLRESVWLEGSGDLPRAVRGDRVSFEGVIDRPSDPGFAQLLQHEGIAVGVEASSVRWQGGAASPFTRATQIVRAFLTRSIDRLFPPDQAGLLLGLSMGDASQLDAGTSRDFQATGLGHLLVVSGENVAMVLAPVLALAAACRLGARARLGVGLATVLFFVALTGAGPSVMRAGVMATITLLGMSFGRPRSTATVLAGAVWLLIVLDPWLVWSIGFQLSVAATAGMALLAGPLGERFARHLPRPVAFAAGATMAAQLGVTPLLLFHFHEVPGVTLVANLAAFPAVSPALVLGLVAAGVGVVSLTAGGLLARLASLPLGYLEVVANRLAKAPVSHLTSHGGPAVLIGGVLIVVLLAAWLRSGWRPPRWLVVVGVGAIPLLVWSSALGAGTPPSLTVRFFDVGQGDAALVTTPQGGEVLVDGGPDEEQVATDLAALGVKRLDMVVATHPHADHIVGLPAVLAQVPVGMVLEPGCPDTSAIQANLDIAIRQEDVPVRYPRDGDEFTVGDLTMDVLSPDRCWVGTDSDPNNDSLVILMRYHDDTVLFGAEPEEPAQQQLLDEGAPLHAEVLKVPHHGAATSLPAFFQAVGARIAVISVGPNHYGHPVPSTIEAIQEAGSQVWRTDRRGAITVTFDEGMPVVAADR